MPAVKKIADLKRVYGLDLGALEHAVAPERNQPCDRCNQGQAGRPSPKPPDRGARHLAAPQKLGHQRGQEPDHDRGSREIEQMPEGADAVHNEPGKRTDTNEIRLRSIPAQDPEASLSH